MFLEFDEIGQVNSHLDTGFYAIGGVGPLAMVAQGLMAHYFREPMPLKQGQLIAYRTISAVCEIAQSGVGPRFLRLAVSLSRGIPATARESSKTTSSVRSRPG